MRISDMLNLSDPCFQMQLVNLITKIISPKKEALIHFNSLKDIFSSLKQSQQT